MRTVDQPQGGVPLAAVLGQAAPAAPLQVLSPVAEVDEGEGRPVLEVAGEGGAAAGAGSETDGKEADAGAADEGEAAGVPPPPTTDEEEAPPPPPEEEDESAAAALARDSKSAAAYEDGDDGEAGGSKLASPVAHVHAGDAAAAAAAGPHHFTVALVTRREAPLGMQLHKPSPDAPAAVVDLAPGGQAAAAGVLIGDALLSVGGEDVTGLSERDLKYHIGALQAAASDREAKGDEEGEADHVAFAFARGGGGE
jgi:hypothetical protein